MSSGKVAIVTGGSRGIGKAIVLDLCARGFEVHFSFVSDATAANALIDETTAGGNAASGEEVDARDSAACGASVDRIIGARGRIDVLVNNAGILSDRLFAMMSTEQWRSVMDTSINGLVGTTQPAVKQMMRQKSGRVINLSSVSGVIGIPGQTAYSAAKAAIIGFTRSLSKELGPFGVSANVVAPGVHRHGHAVLPSRKTAESGNRKYSHEASGSPGRNRRACRIPLHSGASVPHRSSYSGGWRIDMSVVSNRQWLLAQRPSGRLRPRTSV